MEYCGKMFRGGDGERRVHTLGAIIGRSTDSRERRFMVVDFWF